MKQNSNDPIIFRILDASVKYTLIICLILWILSPLFR